MCFAKNISFKARNINTIQNYMVKTSKNFSQTVNMIIEEWDKYGFIMRQFQKQQELEKLEKAKIVNPMNAWNEVIRKNDEIQKKDMRTKKVKA